MANSIANESYATSNQAPALYGEGVNMNGMMSAIKSRRGGLMSEEAPQQESDGLDMAALVKALSPDQKMELMSLLSPESGKEGMEMDAVSIEKGGVSPGEMSDLEEASRDSGGESEDQIAESMISSSDKMRSERGDKPRNLGERVKFDLAKKVKK